MRAYSLVSTSPRALATFSASLRKLSKSAMIRLCLSLPCPPRVPTARSAHTANAALMRDSFWK